MAKSFKVLKAEIMGYCMGVSKAITATENALANSAKPVYALGDLIHNRAEVDRLKAKGLNVIEDSEFPPANSTAIIRAHGIHPKQREILIQQQIELIDATCPLVLKNQELVAHYSQQNFFVLILGKKSHPEIKALTGFAKNFQVINHLEEAKDFVLPSSHKKLVLITQTTAEIALFEAVKRELSKKFPAIIIPTSICGATQKRQQAITELCAKVDVIIVIGSKNSSNTVGLYQRALALEKPAFLIENSADIDFEELNNYNVIGITAGASTPQWLIDEIEQLLTNIKE